MKIEATLFEISLNSQELYDIAFCIKRAIEDTVKTHWAYHKSNWETGEALRLSLLKDMLSVLDRMDIYELLIVNVNRIFKEHNENQTV